MSNLFEAVKAIPIESVLREYFPNLEFKRSSRNLVASCPFHSEDTASFYVYLEKNTWHCFGACAKGGSAIDLLLMGEIASEPYTAAKALAQRFAIDIKDDKSKRKAAALTVAQYAAFCALPEKFLVETFSLSNGEAGIEIPYRNEAGEIVSVQRRHKLEKGKKKDGRFTWRKGDTVLPYGLWMLPEFRKQSGRLVIVEGASDVHVLTYCGSAALGIPGAGNFKPEMASSLLPFDELVLIQEPGAGGETFIASITAALKGAEYRGAVRAAALPEKDPRGLWLKSRDKAQFATALDQAIGAAAPIDLYPPIPLTRDLIDKLEALFRRHVFFKDHRYPLLLALWVMGSYLHRTFSYFGYLHIGSPVMRCAKTLLLDILAQVAADTTGRTSNLTESVVFHLSHKGKTFIVDELENMRNQDREKYGAVMAVLNAGFQSGAKVYRMKKTENGFEEQEFNAYSPKAIAGINKLSDTLEDRSFHIAMTRKTKAEIVERFSIRRQGKKLEALRAELKLWAAEREKSIADLYDAIDQILQDARGEELRALDDRFLDICEPLLSISLYADIEHSNGGGQVTARLRDLLLAMAGAKSQEAESGDLAAVFGVLKNVLGNATKDFISSTELLEKIQPEISWMTSKKRLASFLGRFGLVSGKDLTGVIRGYTITKEWLEDFEFRYLPHFETSKPSETRAQSGSEGIL